MGADANHRSKHLGGDTIGCLGVDQRFQPPAVLSMTGRIPAKGVQQHVDIRENHPRFSIMSRRDRKSTRLNSSHRCISYAVFCLKKKTKQNNKSNIARIYTKKNKD